MIRAAGSSGTAVTIWGAAFRKKTRGRSDAGSRSSGTSPRLDGIVRRATSPAASCSAKHCFTGPTIVEKFEAAHASVSTHHRDSRLARWLNGRDPSRDCDLRHILFTGKMPRWMVGGAVISQTFYLEVKHG